MKPQITFKIHRLNHSDVAEFRDLVKIFKHVFDSKEQISDDSQLGRLLSNPDFMVFVIKHNEKIVGGLTIYILHSYFGKKAIAYIYDIGVNPDYQGKGLGKSLIAEVCRYCNDNEFKDAFVEAESDDIDAVNFYRKTNYASAINATVFTYTFEHKD